MYIFFFEKAKVYLSLQHETKKNGQPDCNEKEKTEITVMAGKTLMSFLTAGLS